MHRYRLRAQFARKLEFGAVRALIIAGALTVFNSVVDNVIKPRFMKQGFDMGPFVMFTAILFWSYVLGPTGALLATMIAADRPCRRPARPARCHVDAIVPGYPAITAMSSAPMSMPSSSALVATTARTRPSRSPRSISRRRSGRYPPR